MGRALGKAKGGAFGAGARGGLGSEAGSASLDARAEAGPGWDDAGREAMADAIEEGADLLEDECLRRARDGLDEPRFHEGKICGYVRKYSDTLLIFLLKARRPAKYRDRISAKRSGDRSGPIAVSGLPPHANSSRTS